MIKRILSLKVLLVLIITHLPSQACPFEKSMTKEQIAKADVVFVGRATKINRSEGKRAHTISFTVEKVLKGKDIGKTIEVFWQNGTFGESDDLSAFHKQYGPRNEVAIVLPGTIKAHTKCEPTQGVTGDGKRITTISCSTDLPVPFLPQPDMVFEKPWIISEVCSRAYIQNAGSKMEPAH